MRLDVLILGRLSCPKPPQPKALRTELRRLAAPGATDAEFQRMLEARLVALAGSGLIKRGPFKLTDAGRARLAKELGLSSAPTWAEVRDRHLPARALGTKAVAIPDEMRAAVLAHALRLPTMRLATLLDAVVAAELGLDGPITMARIRMHLLARRLGVDLGSGKPKALVARAIATAVKAPRSDVRSLRAALAQRWLAEDATPPPEAPARWTDTDVITAVADAVTRAPATGRWGPEKVFVSSIWRQLGEGAAFPGLTLDDLKARLVTASRMGTLTLARADLVGAMDPRDVAASEIRDRNATFHFVLDRSRP